jgi:type VI secretion system protein ImpL
VALAVRYLVMRRRAARFHAELKGQEGEDGSSTFRNLEELQRKMNDAVATLKSSDLGVSCRGSAALYALPWFMIIGPSAAGKTTLLRHSGLHFPCAEDGDIDVRGFGGTRNCDWWFSNEAVLLDTAGRYTTEPADHREWKAFLGLLRKHRRRMPINGVLVAMSLEDLVTADQKGIEQHVKIIRDRINELITDLGCRAPVYLVITKCDLLHGFSSFVEDLAENDRNQVWGAWLGDHQNSGGMIQAFDERLRELYRRLCSMRLRKMSMQRRLQAKSEIYDFPAQFEAATENIGRFVRLLLKENPYQETPRFCGFYLTSATQEGTPLQCLLGHLRSAFGYVENHVAPHREETRSFFVKKLFQDIIFPNAAAATKSRRREVMGRCVKSCWVAASLALIVSSFFILSTSLTSNTLLLQRGTMLTEQLQSKIWLAENQPQEVVAVLKDFQAHYDDLMDKEKKLPWHLLLGVYRGGEQIEPTRKLLIQGLDAVFYQTVATALEFRLENQIRRWETANPKLREELRDLFYQNLRTYLMLGRPEHMDIVEAAPLLVSIWREKLDRDQSRGSRIKNQEQQLHDLVTFYLEHLVSTDAKSGISPWLLRNDLIFQAREQLRTPPNAERLYAQIIQKSAEQFESHTLQDLIKGNDFGILHSRFQLPGVFTEKGWNEFVRENIERSVRSASLGDWVTGFVPDVFEEPRSGDSAEFEVEGQVDWELAARLQEEIRRLYFADYVEAWYGLLESVRFSSVSSFQDASRKLTILARSDGPLGELMRVVSRNINLVDVSDAGHSLAHLVEDGSKRPVKPVAELEGALRDLRKFCDPADKMSVSLLINQYLLAISTLQAEIETLGAAVDVPREAAAYAANILSGAGAGSALYKGWVSTSSLLGGTEARTRRVAGNLLMAPVRQIWKIVLDETRKDLERNWKNSVHAVYNHKLQGRFPFTDGALDASLIDVADFFRPEDGVLWSFVANHLSPFLSRGSQGWHQKTWLDQGPNFSRDLLDTLDYAQSISAGLFRHGSQEAQVHFYLYPLPSRGMSEMYLHSNGQDYRYRNEPQEWRKFQWPGDMERLGARVRGISGTGSALAELAYEGVWGLFHLLDQAKVTAESGVQYLAAWELDGMNVPVTIQFRIRADREQNIFERGLFSRMQVPENIF